MSGENKFLSSGAPDQLETSVWGWVSCALQGLDSLRAYDSGSGASWFDAWPPVADTCLWLDEGHPPFHEI